MPWKLYDDLIAGVPDDVMVTDYCLGLCWSYVEAECGTGVSYTCRGGATKPNLRGGRPECMVRAKEACRCNGCHIR